MNERDTNRKLLFWAGVGCEPVRNWGRSETVAVDYGESYRARSTSETMVLNVDGLTAGQIYEARS